MLPATIPRMKRKFFPPFKDEGEVIAAWGETQLIKYPLIAVPGTRWNTFGRWRTPCIRRMKAAAAAWIKPLKEKLLAGDGIEVITDLDDLLKKLRGSRREAVQAERNYLDNNRERLDYQGAKERGEPLGSGAMESTCKQYQGRFHRSGQFWTKSGDEALMCLETFWRNGRWALLFPHVPPDSDASRN